ncbi:hypothetical protein [Simkania sp.]|uniref:hypothetical protein n=1 Tax=Simkania sp. TaxID=34094 RepID=UPI003B5197AC
MRGIQTVVKVHAMPYTPEVAQYLAEWLKRTDLSWWIDLDTTSNYFHRTLTVKDDFRSLQLLC